MADNEDERFAFITDEIIAELSDPTFDMWRYSREQLVPLIVTMYKELGLPEEYDIDLDTLYNFVDTVRQNYSDSTPFHNFHHAFCVTQMVYCVLRATEAEEPFLNKFEKLALLISANIHDADHRGLTNNFYINSRDELAITYNDRSVLENHHCATGFRILSSPYCNILKNLSIKQYKEIRDIIVECVLSTDMSRHFKLRGEFMELVQAGIDWENSDNRKFVCQFILMCSDISNEVRPWWVSRPWATNLMEEFFAQTDLEKKMGMPFLPFMDRAQAKLENGQVGFIRGILRPIWVILADFLPVVAPYVDRIDSNLEHWQKFAEHERHRILVHMVAKDNSPGTIYDAGDVIVRMGEVSEEMYFIVRGAVDVLGPDMETVWDSMSKGAFFGEVGAFKQVPRTANIVAKVDSEVLVVRKDELLDLLEQFPEHQDVIKNVAEERFEKHKERLDDEHLVEFAG